MKLGMPQLFEFDNIEDNLKLAKELNLDFIELNLNFGYCRKEMEAKTVADLLKKYNIKATLHFYDEADFGTYQEVAEAYLIHMERYCALGEGYIRSMNIHAIPGPVCTVSGVKNYIYEKDYADYISRLLKNLKKAEEICNKHGIMMTIEQTEGLVPYMERTYKDMCDNNFKFCIDVGHVNVSSGKFYDWCDKYPLHFYESHFHDGDGKRCHLALGTGTMDKVYAYNLVKKHDEYAKAHGEEMWVNLEVKCSDDLKTSVPYFRNLMK